MENSFWGRMLEASQTIGPKTQDPFVAKSPCPGDREIISIFHPDRLLYLNNQGIIHAFPSLQPSLLLK